MELDLKTLKEKRLEILSKIEGFETKLVKTLNCEIVINNRMRSAAGRAKYRENKVELNGRLLSKNPEHIEQTFAHELAHLAAVELFGKELGHGHGRFWQSVMSLFGYPADRCHELDTEGISRKQKPAGIAQCGCRERIELKKRKVNNILRGLGYRCRLCRQSLELIDILDPKIDALVQDIIARRAS